VYHHSDPNEALSEWYRLFLGVLDKHAPFREKRVKNSQLPAWFNNEIKDAMQLRDELKRQKDFVAFRKQRNYVKFLIRKAQKSLFHRLVDGKKDIVSVWRALNAFKKSKKPLGVQTYQLIHSISIFYPLLVHYSKTHLHASHLRCQKN
jgi:uncharacterized protein (UPF0305 family)